MTGRLIVKEIFFTAILPPKNRHRVIYLNLLPCFLIRTEGVAVSRWSSGPRTPEGKKRSAQNGFNKRTP